jgi:hypothetical protein
VTLPASLSLHSGVTAWSGSLSAGQAITFNFAAQLDAGLAPGSVFTIPMTFTDADHEITFHREMRVGISRPDLSTGAISVTANPARPSGVVTWTIVARNTGPSIAPSATITGLLPLYREIISGTLAASIGSASHLSGTVWWRGSIPAGGAVTLTYQMSVPFWLDDWTYYSHALFDDGKQLNYSGAWLVAQPYRVYLPVIRKSSP